MSYLQTPDALLDSNVFFALSPTAKNIYWLACRKHMKFWTEKKKLVIFGLAKSEIVSLGIGHNHIAPALRELQAAGIIVLIQAGFRGDKARRGVVSQYRLAFLDEGRRHVFEEPHTVDEWKEILTKAREYNGNSRTPKQGHVRTPKQGLPPNSRTPKQGLFYIYGHYPRGAVHRHRGRGRSLARA
jgi:hypothetical protein